MRANILLNPDLMAEVQKYVKIKSKSAIIELALRTLIEVKAAEQMKKTYETRVTDLQSRLSGLRFRESSHQMVKSDRQR